MSEIIQKLKPHVTNFSVSVARDCKHGDTVTVGGKVVSILNLQELVKDALDENYRTEGVYITLDDGIGETQICLPPKAHDWYHAHFGEITHGDVLLAKGKVHHLNTKHTYTSKRGHEMTHDAHKDKTIRVLTYQLTPLPNEEIIKEEE